MRTVTISSYGLVAVVAKYSKSIREALLNKPRPKHSVYLFAMLATSAVNMIYAEKFQMGFAATITFGLTFGVVRKNLKPKGAISSNVPFPLAFRTFRHAKPSDISGHIRARRKLIQAFLLAAFGAMFHYSHIQ